MTWAALILLRALLGSASVLLVLQFCRWRDVDSVLIPAALVLMLCGGVWGLS